MRLTNKQVNAIKECFRVYFNDNSDGLWVFGSRVDAEALGGDIDLYIETNNQNIDELYQARIDFICSLKRKIGDQKIDVVLNIVGHNQLAIYEIAKTTGVKLI